jgi:cyclophilin family peptidyl-prolyl cis-trans isomerase
MVIVHRQSNLLQVVLALSSSGRFTRLLNSRKQESDQHCDNRNDDQQFNERKRSLATTSANSNQSQHFSTFNSVQTNETRWERNPKIVTNLRKTSQFGNPHILLPRHRPVNASI